MLTPVYTTAFKRDVKLAVRRGKDIEKVKTVIRLLCSQEPLPPALHDHPLQDAVVGKVPADAAWALEDSIVVVSVIGAIE